MKDKKPGLIRPDVCCTACCYAVEVLILFILYMTEKGNCGDQVKMLFVLFFVLRGVCLGLAIVGSIGAFIFKKELVYTIFQWIMITLIVAWSIYALIVNKDNLSTCKS